MVKPKNKKKQAKKKLSVKKNKTEEDYGVIDIDNPGEGCTYWITNAVTSLDGMTFETCEWLVKRVVAGGDDRFVPVKRVTDQKFRDWLFDKGVGIW